MTEQQQEPAQPGTMSVRIEGSVTDNVFRIDAGVEDIALLTLHFNAHGAGVMDQLIDIIKDKWDEVYEGIIESYEAQVAREQADGVAEGKHRAEGPADPGDPEVVETQVGEGIE